MSEHPVNSDAHEAKVAGTADGAFRAGAAKIDITPKALTGINPMGGSVVSARAQKSRSFSAVHDRLYVRALVLDDGVRQAALISTDSIEIGDTGGIRNRIEQETGIQADHVIIAASHSHNTPRLGKVSPGARSLPSTEESLTYSESVYDAMLEAVQMAKSQARPARFGAGRGHVDVNVNQEEYADGAWGIGWEETAPSDKTLWVLRVDTLSGDPIAVAMNYSVHPTVGLGTGEVTTDIAGAAATFVESRLGEDVVALWTAGALGDQWPRVRPHPPAAGGEFDAGLAYSAIAAQGLMIGAEAVRVAGRISDMTESVRIRGRAEIVPLPTRDRSEIIHHGEEDVPTVDLRLSLITINDVALAGVSGEVVTRILWKLRQSSPLTKTILISLANDRIGYLTDDASYDRATSHPVRGCPIVRGHAERGIVNGLTTMIASALL